MHGLFDLAKKIETRVAAGRVRADKLIQSTLAKAFKGELVPTEAELAEQEGREYETAEALLERIRQAQSEGSTVASPRQRRRTASPTPPSNGRYDQTLFDEDAPDSGSGRASGARTGSPTTSGSSGRSNGSQNGSGEEWVEITYDEAMAVVREAFAEGGARDREQAVRDVVVALGYERVGSRVRETVDGYLRAAVRRGILFNEKGWYNLVVRSAADYGRDHLIDALIASMNGGWTARDEAVRATAKHLGFQKAGGAFQEAMRSAINAAIRRGLLEYDGEAVRKVTRG